MSTNDGGPAFCLVCNKTGHMTTECWSTYAVHTPADNELQRLCLAAHLAGAASMKTEEIEAMIRAREVTK